MFTVSTLNRSNQKPSRKMYFSFRQYKSFKTKSEAIQHAKEMNASDWAKTCNSVGLWVVVVRNEKTDQLKVVWQQPKDKRIVATTKIQFNRGMQEYVVKAYDQYGKRFQAADYYTSEYDDANETAKEMVIN